MDKEKVIKQLGEFKEVRSHVIRTYWFVITKDYNNQITIQTMGSVNITPDDIKALNYIVEHPEEFFEREGSHVGRI